MVTNLVPRERLSSLAGPLHDVLDTADSYASEGIDRATETGKALLDAAADRVHTAARTIGHEWTPPKQVRRRQAQKRALLFGLAALVVAAIAVGFRQAKSAPDEHDESGADNPSRTSTPSSNGRGRLSSTTPAH